MRSRRSICWLLGLALASFAGAGSPALASHHHYPTVTVHVGGGFFWGSPFPYWGYPYPYGPPYAGYVYPPPEYALVDTDVEPEKAKVILDGEEVGTADDYDGFPDYLVLAPGRHVLEFRAPGRRTLRITLHARRGQFFPIDRRLLPASPGNPESPGNPGNPGNEAEGEDWEALSPGPPSEPGAHSARPSGEEGPESPPPSHEGESEPEAPSAARAVAGSATLLFRLRPQDAAVYLDGRLLGAGEALRAADGVRVEPGRHTLEVVKPGFGTYRTTLVLQEAEDRTLTIRLVAAKGEKPL